MRFLHNLHNRLFIDMFASASATRSPPAPSASRYPPAPSTYAAGRPFTPSLSLPFSPWDVAGGPQFTGMLFGTALTLLASFCLRRALLLKRVSSTPQHSQEVNWVFACFVLWSCSLLLVSGIAGGAAEHAASEVCVLVLRDWHGPLATCIGSARHLPRRTSILLATLLLQLLLSYVLFAVMVAIVVLGKADKKLGIVSKTALRQLCSALPSLCRFRSAKRRRKVEIWSKILSECCENSDVARQYLWTGPCLFGGSLISLMSQVVVMLHVCPGNAI